MKLSHVENSLFKADGFMCFSTIVLSALLPILFNNVSLIIFLCYLNRSQTFLARVKWHKKKICKITQSQNIYLVERSQRRVWGFTSGIQLACTEGLSTFEITMLGQHLTLHRKIWRGFYFSEYEYHDSNAICSDAQSHSQSLPTWCCMDAFCYKGCGSQMDSQNAMKTLRCCFFCYPEMLGGKIPTEVNQKSFCSDLWKRW